MVLLLFGRSKGAREGGLSQQQAELKACASALPSVADQKVAPELPPEERHKMDNDFGNYEDEYEFEYE